MNEDLKLEERNIENTHPSKLKRLHNENFDRKIKSIKNKKEFFIINFALFALISIMFYEKSIIFSSDISIISSVIVFLFSLAIIMCELLIKDELFNQKISNSILDSYIS